MANHRKKNKKYSRVWGCGKTDKTEKVIKPKEMILNIKHAKSISAISKAIEKANG